MRKTSYASGTASAHTKTRPRARHDVSETRRTARKTTVMIARSGRTSGPRPISTQLHHAVFVRAWLGALSGTTRRHNAHQDAPNHATPKEPSSPEVAKSHAGGSAANTRSPAGIAAPSPTTLRQSRMEPAEAKAKQVAGNASPDRPAIHS